LSKYKAVATRIAKYFEGHSNARIPLYSNFACYLGSSGLPELMKFTIFQAAFLAKGKVIAL
jgi:hypothetical protein